ncbi:RusA family crossover junction endodeoxyribonuclease [Escherichia coli]|uniref:RusA family crossover junction endodeoxyribonuclease n=1 Tax=Escherichia coli TaxID=562 RepID=UPI000DE034F0|nr:RusA family crossover junction endodeoxyribonuclease [Escherichia coli]ELD4355200.1 RusA family crossover junction endodeoxyribonuclease [Escherichia coli]HAM7397850.1 RusA family crossover junction endodeoxyribonuclease [Escherichia coli]
MNEYTFILPYPPSCNRYYRHARGVNYISKEGKKYREWVREVIRRFNLDINLKCRLSITVYIAPPDNRRRDIDNIGKALFDAITYSGFWADDSQVDAMKFVRCRKVKGGLLFIKVRERNDMLPDINEYLTDMWGDNGANKHCC